MFMAEGLLSKLFGHASSVLDIGSGAWGTSMDYRQAKTEAGARKSQSVPK